LSKNELCDGFQTVRILQLMTGIKESCYWSHDHDVYKCVREAWNLPTMVHCSRNGLNKH